MRPAKQRGNPYNWYTQGVCDLGTRYRLAASEGYATPSPRAGRAWAGMTILAVTAAAIAGCGSPPSPRAAIPPEFRADATGPAGNA